MLYLHILDITCYCMKCIHGFLCNKVHPRADAVAFKVITSSIAVFSQFEITVVDVSVKTLQTVK